MLRRAFVSLAFCVVDLAAGSDRASAVTAVDSIGITVSDLDRSVDFYTNHLGFTLGHQQLPAFAAVSLERLTLLLSGPEASGSRPMPDGQRQGAGGWNRIVLRVTDLPGRINALKAAGLAFRNEMEIGPGGRQIQLLDPDSNPIELFEPAGQRG